MTDKKISELNAKATIADDDLFAIVDTGSAETKKITGLNMKTVLGVPVWTDDGTDVTPVNAGRNVDVGTGLIKDNDVTSGVALGDSGNTSYSTTNQTIIGSVNELDTDKAEDSVVLKKDGSVALTTDWDAGDHKITSEQFESDIASGTAPLIVASNSKVTNLNADLLDGYNLDQDVRTNQSPTWAGATFTGTVTGVTPTSGAHLTTKEYVDTLQSFSLDYFFNDTSSDIGGIYYDMTDNDLGGGESTLTTSGLGIGDNQPLVNFATLTGEPGVNTLSAGVYDCHFHVARTAGNRTVVIYYEIYERTAGGVETLRMTSELSDEITTKTDIDLHAVLASDVEINTTDRIIVKVYANVSGGGADVDVTLYQEGSDDSRLKMPVASSVLSDIFVRQDGTKPLTADWDAGDNKITTQNLTVDSLTTVGGIVQTDGAGALSSSVTLPDGTLATTQSPADNSTKLATTAYVDSAIGGENLWDRVTGTPNYVIPHTAADDIGATGARITKGWFTDIESTNMPTVGGTALDSTFAPIGATYITQTPNGSLTGEQALSALSTGIMKSTTGTGVISIAVADTDYQQPVTWGDGLAYSAPTASVDYNTTNLKITSNQIDTIQGISSAASPAFTGLTLSADLGLTGTRVTKGWFTDLEITNMPTVGGTSINANGVLDLTSAEVDQLENIGTTTISATQWGYLGGMTFSTANALTKVNSGGTNIEQTDVTLTTGAANQFTITRGSSVFQILADLTVSADSSINQNVTTTGTPSFTSVNGFTLSPQSVGFSMSAGTTPKTLSLTEDTIIDQNLQTTATGVDFGSLQLGAAGATVALFDTDVNLAADLDTRVATQKAVKAYVDAAAGTNYWTRVTGGVYGAILKPVTAADNVDSNTGLFISRTGTGASTIEHQVLFSGTADADRRWSLGLIGTESGGDAGSDLVWTAYGDSGGSPVTRMRLDRSSGVLDIGAPASTPGRLNVDGVIYSDQEVATPVLSTVANTATAPGTAIHNLLNGSSVSRWAWRARDAEGGSDAGYNLSLYSYTDAGSQKNEAIRFDRQNNFIALPEIQAISSAGLKLYNDGAEGIDVKDNGDVDIQTTTDQALIGDFFSIQGSQYANGWGMWNNAYYDTVSARMEYINNGKAWLMAPDDSFYTWQGYATGTAGNALTGATNCMLLSIDGQELRLPQLKSIASGTAVIWETATGSLAKQSSSARYKENIRDLEISTDWIYKVTPKTFEIKDGGGTGHNYIAEDVAEAEAAAAVYDEEGRPEALNNPVFVLSVIEEVNKLEARIAELEKRI